MREPQGAASLALGYVLHWAFSPPLLNPKLQFFCCLYSLQRERSYHKFIVLIATKLRLQNQKATLSLLFFHFIKE